MLRRRERMDRALPYGLPLVGDDEIEIDADGAPEPLALGARAVGVVERKEARLGLGIMDVALRALERRGEFQFFTGIKHVHDAFPFRFAERCLDGSRKPGAERLIVVYNETVNQNTDIFFLYFLCLR